MTPYDPDFYAACVEARKSGDAKAERAIERARILIEADPHALESLLLQSVYRALLLTGVVGWFLMAWNTGKAGR